MAMPMPPICFVRSRLGMEGMHVFGALPSSEGLARIVEHASVIRH